MPCQQKWTSKQDVLEAFCCILLLIVPAKQDLFQFFISIFCCTLHTFFWQNIMKSFLCSPPCHPISSGPDKSSWEPKHPKNWGMSICQLSMWGQDLIFLKPSTKNTWVWWLTCNRQELRWWKKTISETVKQTGPCQSYAALAGASWLRPDVSPVFLGLKFPHCPLRPIEQRRRSGTPIYGPFLGTPTVPNNRSFWSKSMNIFPLLQVPAPEWTVLVLRMVLQKNLSGCKECAVTHLSRSRLNIFSQLQQQITRFPSRSRPCEIVASACFNLKGLENVMFILQCISINHVILCFATFIQVHARSKNHAFLSFSQR